MNKTKFVLQMVILLALLGAGLWYKYLRSDSFKIKRQLNGLCEDLRKGIAEGNASTALKTVSLGNRLDDRVTIRVHDIPIAGEFSAEEVVSHASRARLSCQIIDVRLLDSTVTIEKDGKSALADCVFRARAISDENAMDDEFHVDIVLVKNSSGEWRFRSFKESKILQR